MYTYSVQAKINPHALGVRFGGDGTVNAAEFSYQQKVTDFNRMEFDLGFGTGNNQDRLYLVGIYHWDWNLSGGLNWFIGPGASIGLYSNEDSNSYINLALGGQLGLEYDFSHLNAPILLSLDARPMWDFIGDDVGLGWGVSLGVRYIW